MQFYFFEIKIAFLNLTYNKSLLLVKLEKYLF